MRKILMLFVLLSVALLLPKSSLAAIDYTLVPPSGSLTRGQDVQFTVTVDTQGATLKGSQLGLAYETQYLQYVNAVPGNALTALNVDQSQAGILLFSGSNPSGFSGTGTYAVVTFRIIASASGSTQLCSLFTPSPTPAPTTPPAAPPPTSPPVTPRVLPQSGYATTAGFFSGMGILTLLLGYGLYRVTKG